MQQYLNLLSKILVHGDFCPDRTGVGTKSLFGEHLRFDLTNGFPLVTTKKVHFKSVVLELLWILSGSTNNNDLEKSGVTIWREWAKQDGDLGPVYGSQWRSWNNISTHGLSCIDQISRVIDQIETNPHSRRHIVTAWNPSDIPLCALPPCHVLFQFYVSNDRLSCHLYQRSADMFLGVPFNIASYALLTMMVARVTGLTPWQLNISFGDSHIYMNHIPQVEEQLKRAPRFLPGININSDVTNIFDFKYEDFTLLNYTPHPAIKAEVAV